ncbi:MAG: hypothetical protein GY860_23390 [Desulfobacteraceae bacterium]|nr:hypothetical protein [Desulfobacteraceae bacterium]
MKPNNLEADKESYEYKKLCRETVKACIPIAQVQIKREQGDYSDDGDIVSSILQPPKAPIRITRKAPSGPLIKPLVDE